MGDFQPISRRISETVTDGAKTARPYWSLIGSRISHFTWHENYRPWMTLKGHCALCYGNRASVGARQENFKDDRPILSAEKNITHW